MQTPTIIQIKDQTVRTHGLKYSPKLYILLARERSKNMKKPFICLTSLLLIFCLSSVVIFASCQNKDKSKIEETSSEELSSLESGEIDGTEHLSPEEPTEIPTTEVTTEEITEAPTEAKTEETTTVQTEKETEEPTEPPKPIESLKYTSYGNGTCAVSGIGTCKDTYIIIPEKSPEGDIVTAIEEKAFYGNTDIKAVYIPSTVSFIGKYAFGGCSSIVYISVDKGSNNFKDIDGVLYTKDETRLILFPSASKNPEITISLAVKIIDDMAFVQCDSLKSIKYAGTFNNWSNIDIGDSNAGLYSASITFAAH